MAILQVNLLGEFGLVYQQTPVTALYQPRQQALLAFLLLHRDQPQLRQQLAFRFWPDSTEPQARANLRQLLHDLRHELPDATHFLQVEHKTVQWRVAASCVVDLIEFEQILAQAERSATPISLLTQATQLYRGPLLPSCYEDWIALERERISQRHVAALERLIHLLEAEREYASAISYAQRLLREQPLHEGAYRALMRLYALCGDRAQALQSYQTCATRLADELGVEPDPLTKELYQQLLATAITPRPLQHNTIGSEQATPLVGRQQEWQSLQRAWQQANQGQTHCVVIEGEAGIGKTRVSDELGRWARQQGIATAYTRAYAAEGDLAYGPLLEWLRSAAFSPALTQLDHVWRQELARLMPDLSPPATTVAPTPTRHEQGQRQRLFQALARTVLLIKAPLLLLMDDAQWADQDTIEWLHYLLRFDRKARLLLLITIRPEEVTRVHPVTTLLLHLQQTVPVTKIELAPLTTIETAQLTMQLSRGSIAQQTSHAIFEQTRGNPLYIVELVRAHMQRTDNPEAQPHVSPLPATIQATIERRLMALSPVARQLVEYAAICGRAFSTQLLAQFITSEAALFDGLEELWQRRIIQEQTLHSYDFSHDYLRDVAYHTISPIRRRYLHRQAAQALETMAAHDLDAVSSQVASHYEQADAVEQAVGWYQRAAAVANQRFAYREAISYLEKLLRLLDRLPVTGERDSLRLDVLLRLGHLWTVVKSFAAAEVEAAYTAARTLCQRVNAVDHAALALRGLWNYWLQRCNWERTAELEQDLFRLAGQTQHPIHQRRAYWCRGTAHFHQGRFPAARVDLQQALACLRAPHPIADPHDPADGPTASIHHRLASTLWLLGYPEQAEAQLQQALAIARRAIQPQQRIFTLQFALWLAQENEQPVRVQRLLAEFDATLLPEPVPIQQAHHQLTQGWLAVQAGDYPKGISYLQAGLAIFQQTESSLFDAHYYAWLGAAYWRAGQYGTGLTLINNVIERADQLGTRYWQAELYRLRAELLLGEGHSTVATVEDGFQQAIAIARQQGARMLELRATISLAQRWQQQARPIEAYHLLRPVYAWFTEGFMLPDLQHAQRLLAQLQVEAKIVA